MTAKIAPMESAAVKSLFIKSPREFAEYSCDNRDEGGAGASGQKPFVHCAYASSGKNPKMKRFSPMSMSTGLSMYL